MMYGNPSVATFQGGPLGSVWDINYVGIWHLSDNAASTTVLDSTSNGNVGTNQANTNTKATTGEIAGALNYNGLSDYTSVAGSSSLDISTNMTVSAWIKGSNNSTEQSIFGGYAPVSPWSGYGFELYYGALRFWSSAQGSWVGSTSSSYADGNWHYVVVVDNGSSAAFYKDGVADGTPTVQNPGAYTGSRAIGGRADGAQSFNGTLEEVRVSNVVRSSDWISAEYSNQNYPPGFYSVGQPNSGGQGSTVGVVQTHITNIGSNSASFSNPVTRGNLLVSAVLCVTCSNATMSVSDTLGGNWQVLSLTGFNGAYEVWWSIAPASGSDNVTIHSNVNAVYWDLALAELTGVAAPDQVQTSTMSYVNSVSSGSVATSAANEVLLGLVTDIGSSEVPSSGAGWTMPPSQQYQLDLEYQSVSSIGSYAATWNYTTTPTSQAQILTFMPSTLFATSSIFPSSGLPTQAVTITGTGFGGAVGSNSVLFNGIQGTIVSWGESSIVVEVPQSISTGTASVVVTLNGITSNAQTFTVVSGPGVVQTQVVSEGPSNTTFSYPVTQGNVLTVSVVCASCWNATLTIADGLGSTWHAISTSSDSAGVYAVWWTTAPASGSDTVTISTTVDGSYICTAMAELYGVTSADQTQVGAGTGDSVSSGMVTAGQANEVLLGTIFNQSSGELMSQGSGWVLAPVAVNIQGEHPFQLESQVVSSVGTYSATGTYTSSPTWRANIVTFIGSANGGGGASVQVSVTPSTTIVGQSGTEQFSAVVTGTSNQSVTWSTTPLIGSISSGGLYTAPATITSGQTITVKAISNQDDVTFATATITLAPPTASGVYYYFEDQLGTSRVIADSTGNVCYDADFYPYGGERAIVDNCPQDYKFTGKERDEESQLDNFEARYYSWQMGRFMTPDWSKNPQGVPYADFDDPQTLNLYSYVRDNPASRFDEDGHAGDCVTHNCYADILDQAANSAKREELAGQTQQQNTTAQQQADKTQNSSTVHKVVQKVKTAAAAVGKARAAEQAWLAKHPNVEALIMIGAIISGGGEAAEGEGEAIGEAGEALQYSDRVAARSAQDTGPNHNFPSSFDSEIIQSGQKTVGNSGYTQYNLRGSINGKEGTYEIGVQNGQIVHRFFRPNP